MITCPAIAAIIAILGGRRIFETGAFGFPMRERPRGVAVATWGLVGLVVAAWLLWRVIGG